MCVGTHVYTLGHASGTWVLVGSCCPQPGPQPSRTPGPPQGEATPLEMVEVWN